MSVLIKDMEMPKSCPECPLADYERHCPLTGNTYSFRFTQRPSDCPLIEVPLHGRLIDVDKLDINQREEQAWRDWENNPDNEYLEGVAVGCFSGHHPGRGGRVMRNFNTVKADLSRHLKLSCQKTDGEILWYEGTLDVLAEFLSILHQKEEEKETCQ